MGKGSIHLEEGAPYINYENFNHMGMLGEYADGTSISEVTPRLYLSDPVYNQETRTFTGTIDLSLGGVTSYAYLGWVSTEYTMIFFRRLFENRRWISKIYQR
jgi:hypothetical protein